VLSVGPDTIFSLSRIRSIRRTSLSSSILFHHRVVCLFHGACICFLRIAHLLSSYIGCFPSPVKPVLTALPSYSLSFSPSPPFLSPPFPSISRPVPLSGGMFRLVKVNSDKEPQLSQTLGVSGLPTVFAVNGGKLTDRCRFHAHNM
jgi:hypothetical protein